MNNLAPMKNCLGGRKVLKIGCRGIRFSDTEYFDILDPDWGCDMRFPTM